MVSEISIRAQKALGVKKDRDWVLEPEIHAASLPPEAGPLKRVLESEDIKSLMQHYTKSDTEANRQQKIYKRWGGAEIRWTLYASLIGAIFLLPLPVKDASEFIKWFAVLIQFFFLFLVFSISAWLALRKPFQKWMLYRGEAEITRVALFDNIMAAKEKQNPGEIPLLPLKLEYFRRYQLDVQRAYYSGRGQQHEKAAGQTQLWKWLKRVFIILWALIAIFAFVFFLSKIQGTEQVPFFLKLFDTTFLPPKSETWILAFGIVISAFYSQRASRSMLNMDTRNAARYKIVSMNLDALAKTELQEARTAAGSDDEKAVLGFVRDVQNLISSEHKEWIILRPHISPQNLGERYPLLQDSIEAMLGR